jgi:NADH-quinone oxidoreductase subunit C
MAEDKETPEPKDAGKPSADSTAAKPAAPDAPVQTASDSGTGGSPPADAKPEKPAPPKAAPVAPPEAGESRPTDAPVEKPATPKAASAAPPKAAHGPLIDSLKGKFGDAITEAVATLGQQIVRIRKGSFLEFCRHLRDDTECAFDMCADMTAVHWPDRKGEEFDIVLQLYSVAHNRRLRVKTAVADGEEAPSVTPIWAGADWMEREAFDMFGVRFDGHPDLRRILLPSDWPGYPLRKEYPIEYRDNEWTDKHLEYRDIDYDTSLIDVKYRERR